MAVPELHRLRELQEELARQAFYGPLGRRPGTVAGVDVAYEPGGARAYPAVVVLSWPELEVLEEKTLELPVSFPYLPGYLSFREVPLIKEVLKRLRRQPELIFVDGQGLAHPRKCGLAVHLGVELRRPTIGCAKKPLLRDFEPPGERPGDRSPIFLGREVVGYAVRTRRGVKPVYVSPGYGLTVEEAVDLVLEACRGYRLPEPLRRAHQRATRARNG